LLREWLPGWFGSVVLHGAAIGCFFASAEYGPQVWPVARGHSSVASAPAIDARAGGLLASFTELSPPVQIETLKASLSAVPDQSRSDSRTIADIVRATANSANRVAIEQEVSLVVRALSDRPQEPSLSASEVVRVSPECLRDDNLSRPIVSRPTESESPSEEQIREAQSVTSNERKSETGTSATPGNASENATASNASAAAKGADDNQLPQPVATNPAPLYPEESRAAGQQGNVTLRLRIGVDGRVETLKLLQSSGVSSLDESALTTVKKWRFEPARRLGKPVAMDVKTVIKFEIEAESKTNDRSSPDKP
jgi:protein TonB